MKKSLFPLLLGSIFLAACQPLGPQQPLTQEAMNSKDQSSFSCSAPDYYETIKLDKQVSFTWDEAQEAYVAEVPELCVKFIARAYYLP